jgi:hypothetical protein
MVLMTVKARGFCKWFKSSFIIFLYTNILQFLDLKFYSLFEVTANVCRDTDKVTRMQGKIMT